MPALELVEPREHLVRFPAVDPTADFNRIWRNFRPQIFQGTERREEFFEQ
jgi:hypothetical protein